MLGDLGRGFQVQLWKSEFILPLLISQQFSGERLWLNFRKRGATGLAPHFAHGALGEPRLPRKAQPGWSPNNIAPTAADSLLQFRREITAKQTFKDKFFSMNLLSHGSLRLSPRITVIKCMGLMRGSGHLAEDSKTSWRPVGPPPW